MTEHWHGYFVVERNNIGVGIWDTLKALYENMGTMESPFPMYNNHWRARPSVPYHGITEYETLEGKKVFTFVRHPAAWLLI